MSYTIEELMNSRALGGTPVQPASEEIKPAETLLEKTPSAAQSDPAPLFTDTKPIQPIVREEPETVPAPTPKPVSKPKTTSKPKAKTTSKKKSTSKAQPTKVVVKQVKPPKTPKPRKPVKKESELVRKTKEYAFLALTILGVIAVAGVIVRLLFWLFGV